MLRTVEERREISVRDQHRNVAGDQDFLNPAADQKFFKPAMAARSHHDQISAVVFRRRHNARGGVLVGDVNALA